MPKVKFKIKGIRQLERDIKRLGKLPQVAVNRSAREGAQVAYKAAKSYAPVDTGELKKGLTMKGEKRTKRGKKVYFITLKKSMNDIFVKPYGPNGEKRAYYPASQEWGFTVKGHYTPGYRYLRKSIDNNKKEIERKTLETFGKEIDRALKKG